MYLKTGCCSCELLFRWSSEKKLNKSSENRNPSLTYRSAIEVLVSDEKTFSCSSKGKYICPRQVNNLLANSGSLHVRSSTKRPKALSRVIYANFVGIDDEPVVHSLCEFCHMIDLLFGSLIFHVVHAPSHVPHRHTSVPRKNAVSRA